MRRKSTRRILRYSGGLNKIKSLYLQFHLRDGNFSCWLVFVFYAWCNMRLSITLYFLPMKFISYRGKRVFLSVKLEYGKGLFEKMHISLGSIYVNVFSLKIFVSHLLLWRNFPSCKQFLIVIKQIATCDCITVHTLCSLSKIYTISFSIG